MIALATLCLAGALGVALLILLIARAAGSNRRQIVLLVRPWILAILILLTIGLADAIRGGVSGLDTIGWTIGVCWLVASVVVHVLAARSRTADPTRLWGGRLAHAGIVLAASGILLSSFLGAAVERSMTLGDSIRFAGYTVQLHDVWPAAGDDWTGVEAELRASSGSGVILLKPQHRSMLSGALRTEGARLPSGSGTLSATMRARDADGRWPITLGWAPLLLLTPVGLILSAFGLAIAMVGPALMWRRRLRSARLATAWWA